MILDKAVILINELPEDVDLVQELQQFNSKPRDVMYGWQLEAKTGDEDEPEYQTLVVGLQGDRASVYWLANAMPLGRVSKS